MIIGDDFIFIHTPKAAGMSVTRWLVNNMEGKIRMVVPEAAFDHSLRMAVNDEVRGRIEVIRGTRHETLPEAHAVLEALGLPKPRFVFSIIREPFSLLQSFYKHLQKPRVQERRSDDRSGEVELASDVSFDEFVKTSTFFTRTPDETIQFFKSPKHFDEVDVVPLDYIDRYLSYRFHGSRHYGRYNLETRNKTKSVKIDYGNQDVARAVIENRFSALREVYEAALKTAESGVWKAPQQIMIDRLEGLSETFPQDALATAKDDIQHLYGIAANKDEQIKQLREELENMDSQYKELRASRARVAQRLEKLRNHIPNAKSLKL